ncbi:hypothetical protein WJX72_007113 [[Myrmecia] bisecta]|uniref:Large ribosomal subunit protein uL30m n=1 Tax=[Myrmecia] bisecta TaxID=41462 RepID=A0AAW1Q4Z5_9CHLO
MSAPVNSLFVTLKRSFAGTREHHINIVRSLGLTYREQTKEIANNASVRGAIKKVQHLLTVETDAEYYPRVNQHTGLKQDAER